MSKSQLVQELKGLIGEVCWHVNIGGCTAPTFSLALGKKIPRTALLRNPTAPAQFREHKGEVELYVWSAWRLQDAAQVHVTSEQADKLLRKLDLLTGRRIIAVDVTPPAWDLRLSFDDGTELVVFSTGGDGTNFDGASWELVTPTVEITAGPGSTWSIEPRR